MEKEAGQIENYFKIFFMILGLFVILPFVFARKFIKFLNFWNKIEEKIENYKIYKISNFNLDKIYTKILIFFNFSDL